MNWGESSTTVTNFPTNSGEYPTTLTNSIMNPPASSSTTTSPRANFVTFFRQILSPTRKSPTPARQPSYSAPGSDDIHQVFNYFDENGDGKISATELQNRLRKVGVEELQLSDEEAEMAVRSSDADGDGVLGLDDFAKMMKEGEEEELRGAFGMYSTKSWKGECVITPKSLNKMMRRFKSLNKMMRRLGQATTVDDCKTMIGRFDGNGDEVLDYDEFRAMMS